jgi:hypothetical protein
MTNVHGENTLVMIWNRCSTRRKSMKIRKLKSTYWSSMAMENQRAKIHLIK